MSQEVSAGFAENSTPLADVVPDKETAAQPMRIVERDGVEYTIIGTAHVSRASAEAV